MSLFFECQDLDWNLFRLLSIKDLRSLMMVNWYYYRRIQGSRYYPYLKMKKEALIEMAWRGDREMMEWLWLTEEDLPWEKWMRIAAHRFHEEMVRWIYENMRIPLEFNNEDIYKLGSREQNHGLLRLAIETNRSWIEQKKNEIFRALCGGGHLMWAREFQREFNVDFDDSALKCAIREGHLEVVRWLISWGFDGRREILCDAIGEACKRYRVDIIKCLASVLI